MFKKTILPTICSLIVVITLIVVIITRDTYYDNNVNKVSITSTNKEHVSLVITDNTDNTLYFFSNSQSIKVLVNNEEHIFTNSKINRQLYEIELEDSTLNIEIYQEGVNGKLDIIDFVYTTSSNGFAEYLFFRDIILVVITAFMLFVSILILLLTIYYFILKQKSLMIVGYSLFFTFASIWCLTQVDYFVSLFSNNLAFYALQHYSIFILPIGVAIISYCFNKSRLNKILSFSISGFFLFIALLSGILDLANTNSIVIMNYIALGFTVCYLIADIIILARTNKEDKSKYSPIFFKSLIICIIGLSFDFANILFSGITGPFGMYFSICLLFVYIFTISTIAKEYIIKENYRTYLSEENARLSSSILLSQIKPHFLYNALNSISFLCKKDPQQADMAVIRFSRYLRQNMKCIESSELVDFGSEMEHIKNYIYLENIRFPKMEIVYELKYINFKVPPLCIQPIVENAVKHGVSKNTEGGYVVIKSFITAKNIIIEISDNGPGFDTKVNMKGTGLSNISRRLKMLIDAEIEFGSIIGKGTIVRVKIPRKDVK